MVPLETLASPVTSERETKSQTCGEDNHAVIPDQCVEASPLHPGPEDASLMSSTAPLQDPPASFSPNITVQIVLPEPEGSVSQQSQLQYQAPHQISKDFFAQKQQIESTVPHSVLQIEASASPVQSSVQQPVLQVQASTPPVQSSVAQPELHVQASTPPVQSSVPQPRSSVNAPSQPLHISVSVPQQQPHPVAAGLSKEGDDSAVQQHTKNSEFQLFL